MLHSDSLPLMSSTATRFSTFLFSFFAIFSKPRHFPAFMTSVVKLLMSSVFFHLEPLFIEKLSSFWQNFQTCRESCRSLLSGWLIKRRSCSKLVLTTTLLMSFRSSVSVSYQRSRRLLIGWCVLSLNNGTFDEPPFFFDDILVYSSSTFGKLRISAAKSSSCYSKWCIG